MAEMKIVDSKTKKIRISFKKFQNNPTNQSLLQLYQKKTSRRKQICAQKQTYETVGETE